MQPNLPVGRQDQPLMKLQFSKRLLAVAMPLLLLSGSIYSQNYFNFNCRKDTTINGCGSGACFDLQTIIPDIHGSSGGYTINPATNIPACLPSAINPGGSGTPTNLTIDDRYSTLINIGFPFPFFGTTYNSLVASTNGLVSFDATLGSGTAFSHYAMLNSGGTLSPTTGTPENLPSTLYDRALIMGPYHDLNPAYTTSPGQKIQYSTVGTAPHRKWVLSFYRVPLYLTACQSMIENTHQIILYESTGVIEVFVYSKQICPGWNEGRAMVGLQNFARTQGIMAPGRRASDAPWGTVGMNETWRFVPSAGASLFKRVEAYNLAGTLLATGTVANQANGTYKTSFPNFCVPSGINSYVVKSVYQKNDDPAVEVFGLDTVRVTVNNVSSPTATVTVTPTNCNNNTGTITVNASGGATPYEYSINGGAYQTGNVFSGLAQNTYTINVRDAAGCSVSSIQAIVTLQNNLTLTVNGNGSICRGATFTPTVVSNGATISWSPATGVSNPNIANPTLSPQATTTYTVTSTLGSCTLQRTFVLSVFEGATANAGPDAILIAGDVYQMPASGSAGTYLWTSVPAAGGLSATNILNPTASPAATTTYTLRVTSPQGCFATDDVTITVIPYCIKVMEAFTPNGDGINEKWLVTNGNCLSKATAEVFNRYGAKVFESNDYKNTWDGTYAGKPLADGTYYYVISFKLLNGKTQLLKGSLTILR